MYTPHKKLTAPARIIHYPLIKRLDKRDNFFGTGVSDPYRWMETANSSDPDLQHFLKTEEKLMTDYLEGHPNRDEVTLTLKKLYSYTKSYCPVRSGSKYLVFKKLGLNDQQILFFQDRIDSSPKVLVDPNVLSPDGTLAITSFEPSPNGDILVYLESQSGSDWRTARFKNISTGEVLPDVLQNIKFTRLSWTKDSLGLIYSCYPGARSISGSNHDINDFQELFYHHIGTPQRDDILLVSYPSNPDYRSPGIVSTCGKLLIVTPQRSCSTNLLYTIDLKQWLEDGRPSRPTLNPIVETWEAEYTYLASSCPFQYFLTNKDAPNFRVIAIDLSNPEPPSWIEILPEKSQNVLEWCQVIQTYIFASYLTDIKSTLQVHNLTDGVHLQSFPLEIGCISYGPSRIDDQDFFFLFESFDTPGKVYRIDLRNPLNPATGNSDPFISELPKKSENNALTACLKCGACARPRLEGGLFEAKVFSDSTFLSYNCLKLVTKQVWFPSRDGTLIPMFIVHCARIKPKHRACLLRAYGAHGYILKPAYESLYTAFMNHMDGIVAVVNARGGGEYGQRWYDAGAVLNKQNTFDDISAGAAYLIKHKYTTSKKLTIIGTSSGGLAAAVCVNQRPDLFAAAILDVGILDMMRFDKFTIGHNWISDYGSPENEQEALNLLQYSPYHNIAVPEQNGVQYPAILVLTSEGDDRVPPCHSFKYIAELQVTIGKNQKQTNPLLLRVETMAGHGYGKPVSKLIQEQIDIICFISYAVGQKFS